MKQDYAGDRKFENISFAGKYFKPGEYENCQFRNCDFSECNLSDCVFTDCEFSYCNLSLGKLTGTTVRDVKFLNSKMLGLHFEDCNEFGVSFSFDKCNLDHSSFYQLKISRTVFRESKLTGVDFTECDLTGSSFHDCDLIDAVFDNTNLEKVDFLTAFNYSLDPDKNRLKKTRFSAGGLRGLLGKYDIIIE
jgi:uncharacterized protein YjbI with pentapeptide repeats